MTLGQLTSAVQNANQNVGGDRLFIGEQSYDVRGIGLIGANNSPTQDIENSVVAEQKGTPVRVRDIADVNIGHAPRLGIVGYNEDPDVVQGIVLMRYGGETPPTLEGIYKRVNYIRQNHILPPGMDIEPYYDRGALVHLTTHTVLENLLVGMALVTVVLLLFLGHGRAALITAVNIPLALLVAFCGLVGHTHFGESHLTRRGRLRDRRRLDGDHDGEHLPSRRPARERLDDRAHRAERARSGDAR